MTYRKEVQVGSKTSGTNNVEAMDPWRTGHSDAGGRQIWPKRLGKQYKTFFSPPMMLPVLIKTMAGSG
jgi:hypothetical protein